MTEDSPRRIGRYRLIRRIGRGGMGAVYLAQLQAGGGVRRLAAVKLILHANDDPRHHAALLAEARLGALLCHPNIVQVLDAGVENGLSWFAMEYVSGLALSELLDAVESRIPPWTAARIVADAGAAVHALHEARDEWGTPLNVVHRDVTPHNLLISWDGDVKLVDLGVAYSSLRGSVTRTGVIKGKLGYMSPEQAGGGAVDRRSDVFALGVQLWEALAGRRLFRGQSGNEVLASIVRGDIPPLGEVAGVPAALAVVATRALAVDPAARMASAIELQRALEEAMSAAGVVVGSREVAELLAHVAPERVREHIRWLPKDESPEAIPEESPRTAPAVVQANGVAQAEPIARRRRVPRLTAAALVAGLAVASALMLRSRAGDHQAQTPRDPRSVTVASAPPPRPSNPQPTATPTPPSPPPVREAAPVAAESPPPTRRLAARRPASNRPAPAVESADVGTLYVNASPTWATIRIDGKPAGTTPTVLSDLPAGPHTVEALALDREPSLRRLVTVQAGGTARVEFDFAKR